MSELVGFMTKLLLSGVLILLSGVFMWQVWRMWGERSLVLTPFDFLEAGKPSTESGEQVARMIRADLVQLAGLYNAGDVGNANAVPRATEQEEVVPMELPAIFDTTFFDTIELKAYGIEFGSIFKSLRRHLESPSEISGNVTHQGEKYSVFLELKDRSGVKDSPRRWTIQYAKDLPDATRSAACRIFRYLAGTAERTTGDAALFRSVDDEDFCLFNHALAAYDQYRLRKAVLSEDDGKKLLAETDGPLANLLSRDVVTFPYVHKLAALVYYEKKKFIEAEGALERYAVWLNKNYRKDKAADALRTSIKSRKLKLETAPAISRLRPLQPGSSLSPLGSKAVGMICCIVRDTKGVKYILGAVEVLGSTAGVKIVQPSATHGGTEDDVVAEVTRATSTMTIARLREDVDIDPRILELGAIKDLESKPADDQAVVTYGFDGQRREGQVLSTGSSLPVTLKADSGESVVTAENTVIIKGISTGVEVGGPVMTTDGKLIGMIFAAGGPTLLVLPVEPVLKELGVELMK